MDGTIELKDPYSRRTKVEEDSCNKMVILFDKTSIKLYDIN